MTLPSLTRDTTWSAFRLAPGTGCVPREPNERLLAQRYPPGRPRISAFHHHGEAVPRFGGFLTGAMALVLALRGCTGYRLAFHARCRQTRRRPLRNSGGEAEAEKDVAVPTRLQLLKFAAPLAAVSVTGPILSTIDTSFVGRCAGTVELAALGPACTVTDLIYLICSTVSTAAINLYAKNAEEQKLKRFSATCLSVGFFVGVVAALISLTLGGQLLQALGAMPVMMGVARKYVVVRALGLPFASMACAMYGLCVGRGDTQTPLAVQVYLSALLNVCFDWLLCAVIPWGASGAAWATVAAQTTSFCAYFVLMRRKGHLQLPSSEDFLPSFAEVKPVFSIFLPVSFIVVCVLSMYACMSGFVNNTQPLPMIAAYKIWITVFAFFALCADPMAAATSTKLPPFILEGSSPKARLFVRRAITCAAGVGAVGGLLGASVLNFVPWIFTQDATVLDGARNGLFHFVVILCFMHPARVCQNSLVVHGDLLFYVIAQTGLSLLFFAGLTLLARRCATGSISAYRSMLTATLIFYMASLKTYGLRVRYLNRKVGVKD